MEIGAQLYTVRDFCKNLNDFSQTLKKIAEIGYKNIQISGTCEYEPEWLFEQLEANDLKCVLTHTPPQRLKDDTIAVAQEHTVFGCRNVGLGCFHFGRDENLSSQIDEFVSEYMPVAEALAQNGKYFMYHNHATEFKKVDNKPIYEHLSERFSPDILGFTLDTYWVQAGGGDPAYWLEKLSGRVPCIHLKDYAFGGKMAVLGEGNINFERVFKKAELSGTEYMLVEQDNCNGENPFDCLKRSYNYLKSRGF